VFLGDFDFELPHSAIALRPAVPRDAAKLLSVRPGANPSLSEAQVRDLPGLLRPGDVMVFNDTKVLPAELHGVRAPREKHATAVNVLLTLLERLPDGSWRAFARPARRLRAGDVIALEGHGKRAALLVTARGAGGEVAVLGIDETVESLMQSHGAMPLPPYISKSRPSDERDLADYQTTYAKTEGAVAAPTAGLHFTPELIRRIKAANVRTVFVTLHVGAGTFLPVKAEKVDGHEIHAERCEISEAAANTINERHSRGGRLIAVGTTSLRLIETAAGEDGAISAYRGQTKLFIKPGYRFRSADLLLTNFHLPRSTLFMLVCAFSGIELMKKAYAHAVAGGFRFYSYGDACLLHRAAQ
jgi:S-adenosylmethionine:tRNA ribosyltransferase-isomerase